MKKTALVLTGSFFGLCLLFTGCAEDKNQMENAYEETPEMTGDPDAGAIEQDTSDADGAL